MTRPTRRKPTPTWTAGAELSPYPDRSAYRTDPDRQAEIERRRDAEADRCRKEAVAERRRRRRAEGDQIHKGTTHHVVKSFVNGMTGDGCADFYGCTRDFVEAALRERILDDARKIRAQRNRLIAAAAALAKSGAVTV